MTKKELEEVFHIEKEITDLERRIEERRHKQKTVKSKGICSSAEFPYTERHYSVDCVVHDPRIDVLEVKLQKFKDKLEIKKQEIEDYIETIPFSEMRQIFRYRYIDNKNWIQIAHEMNSLYKLKEYSEDSVRCKHDRYLEKKLKNCKNDGFDGFNML